MKRPSFLADIPKAPPRICRPVNEHARALGAIAHRNQRERVRAKAREMRAAMGLPPAPELEPRMER